MYLLPKNKNHLIFTISNLEKNIVFILFLSFLSYRQKKIIFIVPVKSNKSNQKYVFYLSN